MPARLEAAPVTPGVSAASVMTGTASIHAAWCLRIPVTDLHCATRSLKMKYAAFSIAANGARCKRADFGLRRFESFTLHWSQ